MQFKKAIVLGVMLNSFAFTATGTPVNKFPITNKTIHTLKARAQSAHSTTLSANTNLPSEKQLGMNHVPVLDQGDLPHDSVFASTAAIDAAIGGHDVVSQLCLIQLGNYMLPNEGTTLSQALSRLENYGFFLKKKQSIVGCDNADGSINYENYHKFSKDMMDSSVVWSPILDIHQGLEVRVDTGKTLNEVHQALNSGYRVTMGFLVQQNDDFDLGTQGTHNVKNDSWVITPKIERDLYTNTNLYIHSSIITGYDNNAITVDSDGKEHKGLFTLRGSRGIRAGDKGDFYMSYDYFRVFVLEAQQILAAE